MTKFKKGDVVILKSGGQEMTIDTFVWNPVTKTPYENKVECVWFVGKKLKREAFYIESLNLLI